jgi:hypothetical protein
MTDTVVSPSGAKRWEVSERPGNNVVGHIDQNHRTNVFTIDVVAGSILSGIRKGPYSSRDGAMAAIAAYTKGTCDIPLVP